MENFLIALGVLIALLGLFNLGLLLRPRPFRPHPAPSQPGEPFELPESLPEPVRRHLEQVIAPPPAPADPFAAVAAAAGAAAGAAARAMGAPQAGQNAPQPAQGAGKPADGTPEPEKPAAGVVRSVVLWGRGRACVRGVWLPMRHKLWLKPGEASLRRSEMTFFMRPVMRGMEGFIDGLGAQETGGRLERGPRADHGQALAMWAASVWAPSFLADPSPGRWEPVDDTTARLVFPFGGGTASLLFHFDYETGRLTHISGRRYSGGEPSAREFWRLDLLEWKIFHGMLLPSHVSVAWGEMGSPWAYLMVDGIAVNVNVANALESAARLFAAE